MVLLKLRENVSEDSLNMIVRVVEGLECYKDMDINKDPEIESSILLVDDNGVYKDITLKIMVESNLLANGVLRDVILEEYTDSVGNPLRRDTISIYLAYLVSVLDNRLMDIHNLRSDIELMEEDYTGDEEEELEEIESDVSNINDKISDIHDIMYRLRIEED